MRLLVLSILAAALAGCGGGGGGGDGGGASRGSFTLSASSLTFTGKVNGNPPPMQFITVHLNDMSAAGMRVTGPSGGWLHVADPGPVSTLSFRLEFSVDPTGLGAGTRSTTLTLATRDNDGGTLQSKDVQITYTLREGVTITSAPAQLTSINGSSAQPAHTPTFTVNSPPTLRWSATSDAAWLVPPAGTQQGPGVFSSTADLSSLPIGHHAARLTLTNVADSTDSAVFLVQAEITPAAFATPAASVLVGGAAGLDVAAVPLGFSLNTAQKAHPWTVELATDTGGSWLRTNVANGLVDAGGTTINISADRSQLAPGVYSGTLTLRATINGQVLTRLLLVRLNHDSNRLVVSAAGVAFSSFPSREVLTRSLKVFNAWDVAATRWNATSDQSWLSVTPSGTSADTLVLNADAGALAPGQYFATVTISSPDAAVSNQQTVRAGLTVGAADPATSIDIGSVVTSSLAASAVEPEVFVATGTTIRVYDIHSGALLRTLSGTFSSAAAITLSDDGGQLYVLDSAANEVRMLRTDDGSGLSTSFVTPQSPSNASLHYARPDGQPVLISGGSPDVYEAFPHFRHNSVALAGPAITAGSSQGRVFTQNQGLSPSTISAYRLRHSRLPAVGLLVDALGSDVGIDSAVRSNGQDVALSADGMQLYVAAGAPYRFDILNPTTLAYLGSLDGDPYPNNVEACWNGLLAAGADTTAVAGDIWIYDPAGALRARLDSGNSSLVRRTLAFSGDGTRLISANGSGLRIQALPAP
jgi:hypothetical protein